MAHPSHERDAGAFPDLVVIGAMKCATTALHRYLDAHPEISMATMKETNFFSLEWQRGVEWYVSLFDGDAPLRGESSPGYTSPDHTIAAARMAEVLPDARLVYLVRDPVERAVSQYEHHVRDGAEARPLQTAVLDPASQYVARGRYFERLQPFLAHFDPEQIHVVVQERLRDHGRRELSGVYAHAGADPAWWGAQLEQRWHMGREREKPPAGLREAVLDRVEDDLAALREFLDDGLPEWDRAA